MRLKKLLLGVTGVLLILLASLYTSATAATPTISSLQKQIATLKVQNSSLQKQVTDQKAQITSLNTQLSKYKSSYVLNPLELKYLFNGKQVSGSYIEGKTSYPTGLVYNGIIYSPINFITNNLGLPVNYLANEKTFIIGLKPEGEYMVKAIGSPYYSNYRVETITTDEKLSMGNQFYYNGYQFSYGYYNCTTGFNLEGKYKSISGIIGLDDKNNHSLTKVQVLGDGKILTSYEFEAGSLPKEFNYDVTGVQKLEFKVNTSAMGGASIIDIANVIIK